MADTKWSQFPSVTPNNSDTVVGLHAGENARFTVANLVAAVRQGLANIFVPKTDIGAANGVAGLDNTGKVPSAQLPAIARTAADVTYDNATSGLQADDVQEALDELAAGAGGSTASTTTYDNTDSGLSATNVQDAIDEIVDEEADQATVAPRETTTTATTAHDLGTIFYLNGVLYRALADIAIGDTINTASGGNATQTTIAENFSRIVKLTSSQYAQLSAAEKAADIVYIVTDQAVDYITPDMIAWPETGTTASRAYSIGEYFTLGGKTCRAKTAIAQGATLTLNTNYEEVPDGGLNDISFNSYYEELGHSSTTGAWQAVNLSSAISKFKYVYIAATYVSGSTMIDRVCLVVPATYFKTKTAATNYVGGYAVVSASNDLLSWGCYYNSDTRASFYTSRSDTQIYLYGCR